MKKVLDRRRAARLGILAAALAAGLFIAWMDSRPGSDDAGVTALALFAAAGIFAFIADRKPWLYGLAVGLWVPLWGVILRHDARFLLALLFPLAGAFAGWALGRMVRRGSSFS